MSRAKRSKNPARKGARPGTRLRGTMQKAYDARGATMARLFNSYSIKTKRDIVVDGELRTLNFVLTESDPCVIAADYAPIVRGLDAAELGFDCLVLTVDRVLRLRTIRRVEAKPSATQIANLEYCLQRFQRLPSCSLGKYKSVVAESVTAEAMTKGNEMRLQNWHRLLPWCELVRYHSLGYAQNVFMAHLQHHGGCSASTVMSLLEDKHGGAALAMAAALHCVANGRCESNLNSVSFGRNTRFHLAGRA